MARAQQQGGGAVTVWMIVFAALWLTSTVFLVFLYTGQEELRNANNRLKADKAQLVSSDEESRIPAMRSAVAGGPTAIGLLEEARGTIAFLASGDATHDVAMVRSKRDELLGQISGDAYVSDPDVFDDLSFHEALSLLYEDFKKEHELRVTGERRIGELDTEVSGLVQLNTDQKADFEQRAKELGDQLVSVESDRSRDRTERDEAVARLEREFEARRAQADADLTSQRQRRAEAERLLQESQKRLVAQQKKFGALMIGPRELATAREPDGRILTAIPGDEIVYINLGRDDRLTLGLQFAVYDAETGIPADGRGKGQIEVVSIFDSSAECKVVRNFGPHLILEGDWIANPVYDASRPPSFLVIGAFDLNRDGAADAAGAAAIESMIADWGGTVTTDLTALTDFVVLGAAPPRPIKLSDPTPEQAVRARSMQALWDHYMETVNAARSLSVPVMTQEVFLNFLGYSGRYARR